MTEKLPGKGVATEPADGAEILAKLRAFRARIDRLESQKERLTRNYPDQWVGLHSGDFVVAKSLDELLEKLEGQGVPTSEVVIQFLDSNLTTLLQNFGTQNEIAPVLRTAFVEKLEYSLPAMVLCE